MWREDFEGIRTEYPIRNRPQLTFDEFYSQFYADSNISPTTISRVQKVVAEQFGIPIGCIRPEDNYLQSDLADTIYNVIEIAEEFGFTHSWHQELEDLDGTFDNVVRHVAKQVETGE